MDPAVACPLISCHRRSRYALVLIIEKCTRDLPIAWWEAREVCLVLHGTPFLTQLPPLHPLSMGDNPFASSFAPCNGFFATSRLCSRLKATWLIQGGLESIPSLEAARLAVLGSSYSSSTVRPSSATSGKACILTDNACLADSCCGWRSDGKVFRKFCIEETGFWGTYEDGMHLMA